MSRVTVIMPVYNGEKFIKEAIQSILNQTYQNFTLLCIDDCSTDDSVAIIRSIRDSRIRIIQNECNRGIAYTRNRGLDIADSEYIALLDDDDIAMPHRLEKEIEYLDKHKDIQVVGGHQRQIDGNGNDLNKQWSVYLNPAYISAYLLLNNTVVNGSTMFRKDFIDRYNIRYKDNMCGAEDYMFWIECSLHGKIKNLDEVFLLWRVAGQNETYRMLRDYKEERLQALYNIKSYALEQWGFKLTKDEVVKLNKTFYEDSEIESKEEIEMIYVILKKIVNQARELKLENEKEVITMCRKRFGEKVSKAFFLWT